MALNLGSIKALPGKLADSLRRPFQGRGTAGEQASGYAQLVGQVVAFVLFAAIAFWVISQVRVNGPIYNRVLS